MSLARVEALLDQLAELPDAATRTAVQELVAVLLDAHRHGMQRLLLEATDAGVEPSALLDDALLRDLLLLHDLHPVPREQRAEAAVAALQRDLGPAGEELTLVRVDDEALEVSLPGAPPQVLAVVVKRLGDEVPDAGPVVVAGASNRRLLPILTEGPA